MTLVYGHFDQVTLDREYDAFPAAAGFDKSEQYKLYSERAISSLDRIADIVYDAKSGSRLDIYPAVKGGPLFIWFHGGYWRASSKNENAFVASGLVPSGITVANVDYNLAPAVTLDEIVDQVRTSVAWLYTNASRFGADPSLIHIGGHSAGGQLVGMLVTDAWKSAYQLPRDIIGVALGVSGLFDMEPIRHSYVNAWLNLNRETAAQNSPIRLIPKVSQAKLLVTYGGKETAEFKRQSNDYLASWRKSGNSGKFMAMPDCHHFDIILALAAGGNALCDTLVHEITSWR